MCLTYVKKDSLHRMCFFAPDIFFEYVCVVGPANDSKN